MNNNELQLIEEIEVDMSEFRFFAGYTSENEYEFKDIESENISGQELSHIAYGMKESRRKAGNRHEDWNLEVYREGEELKYTAEIEFEEGEDYDDEEHPPAFLRSLDAYPEPEALRQEGTLEVTGNMEEEGLEYLLEE